MAANFDLHELDKREWKIDFVWCDKFDVKNSMWTRTNAREDGRKSMTIKYDVCWEEIQELVIKLNILCVKIMILHF